MHKAISTLVISSLFGCYAKKQEVTLGTELEPAVLAGGAAGPQGTVLVEVCKEVAQPLPSYNIVPVTNIISATNGVAEWDYGPGGVDANNDYPFTGPVYDIGDDPAKDGQVGFRFAFDYPSNNFQFSEAHVVIDTKRDTSDTEGIWVDGVFSGIPPDNINTLSPHTTDFLYSTDKGAQGGTGENTYYIDWSLSHYKHNERNTFDLLLSDLLEPTSKTAKSVLKDGDLIVVTGDDSPIFQGYLVIKGLTISSSELSCSNSPTYTLTNVYVHNDGNSTGDVAFDGDVTSPVTSWNNVATYDAFELYFDAPLPKVSVSNTTLTTAQLRMTAKKASTGVAAIVVNGIGVSTTGFDRNLATSAVESWLDSSTTKLNTFMSGVTTNVAGSQVNLDLIDLYGATTVRDLLAQGKLNIAIAGDLYAYASNDTDNRGFASPVNGPELLLNGTYYAEVCTVPDDPNSPLAESGFTPPEVTYETVCETVEKDAADPDDTVVSTGDGPTIASVQALDVSATTATIVWTTNQIATSKVLYGIGDTDQETEEDSQLTSFHSVTSTGLLPYKFYQFKVESKDQFGNASTSSVQVLRTLR
jgi:hypothetical protein